MRYSLYSMDRKKEEREENGGNEPLKHRPLRVKA